MNFKNFSGVGIFALTALAAVLMLVPSSGFAAGCADCDGDAGSGSGTAIAPALAPGWAIDTSPLESAGEHNDLGYGFHRTTAEYASFGASLGRARPFDVRRRANGRLDVGQNGTDRAAWVANALDRLKGTDRNTKLVLGATLVQMYKADPNLRPEQARMELTRLAAGMEAENRYFSSTAGTVERSLTGAFALAEKLGGGGAVSGSAYTALKEGYKVFGQPRIDAAAAISDRQMTSFNNHATFASQHWSEQRVLEELHTLGRSGGLQASLAVDELMAADTNASVLDHSKQIFAGNPVLGRLNALESLIDVRTGEIRADISQLNALVTQQFAATNEQIGIVMADVKQLAAQQQVLVDWVNNEERRRQAAEEQARKTAEHQQIIAAGQASVYLLSTFVGFVDKKAGENISLIGSAALQVYDNLVKWNDATATLGDGIGKLANLSTLALTGNLVGIAMSLVPLFVDTGPSTDELILQGIQDIREDIHELRGEMHDRFDRIDSALNNIYKRLDDGLARIDTTTGEIRDGVVALQRDLLAVSASIDRLAANLYAINKDNKLHEFWDLGVDPYIGLRGRVAGYQMPLDNFIKAESYFRTWAISQSRSTAAVGPKRDMSEDAILDNLRLWEPEENVGYLSELAQQRWNAGFVSGEAANPRWWALGAEAHSLLMTEWPEHASRFDTSRTQSIIDFGNSLSANLRRIVNTGTEEKPVANRALFNGLFGWYGDAFDALDARIKGLEKAYADPATKLFPFRGLDQTIPSPAGLQLRHCGSSRVIGKPYAEDGATTLAPEEAWIATRLKLGSVAFCQRQLVGEEFDEVTVIEANYEGAVVRTTRRVQPMRCRVIKREEVCEPAGPVVVTHVDNQAAVASLRARVLDALAPLRKPFYVRMPRLLSSEPSLNDRALVAMAERVTTAKAGIQQYIQLGFPRALELDDWLHAMLFGNQGLIDDRAFGSDSPKRMLSVLYAEAGSAEIDDPLNPRLLLPRRASVLKAIISRYLDRIESNIRIQTLLPVPAQMGPWVEYEPFLRDALDRVHLGRTFAARDVQPPKTSLTVLVQRVKHVASNGLRLRVKSNEGGNAVVTVNVTAATAKQLRLKNVTMFRLTKRLDTGRVHEVTLRPTKAIASRMRKLVRLRLAVTVAVTDAAGNKSTVRRAIDLRR